MYQLPCFALLVGATKTHFKAQELVAGKNNAVWLKGQAGQYVRQADEAVRPVGLVLDLFGLLFSTTIMLLQFQMSTLLCRLFFMLPQSQCNNALLFSTD
jgi:hypothetical protein